MNNKLLILYILLGLLAIPWAIYFIFYLPCSFVKDHSYLFYRDIPARCLNLK